jgi:sodium-coupled neutral amino acid transporter 11
VRYPPLSRRVHGLTLDHSCFGLNMLTTLPLEAFVCRSVMTTYYFPDEPFNMNRHLIFTSALVLTSVAMALLTCDLGAVFELIGATSAASLAYIFPPLCYIKLSNASRKEKIPAYLCIVFGVTVMGVSLLQAVGKMINSMCSPSFVYSPGGTC